MGKTVTAIVGRGALSASGGHWDQARAFVSSTEFQGRKVPVARLPKAEQTRIAELRAETSKYRHLDPASLMAMHTARLAYQQAGWSESGQRTGVNIGTSRGTTTNIERTHRQHLDSEQAISPFTSPVTTGGVVSSWIASDLGTTGMNFTHSVTCSSGLHAIGNALAWMRSGMADRFLVGGTEAPVTPYTLDQMFALRIHASDIENPFPCRPMAAEKQSGTGMMLGEGAATFALENRDANDSGIFAVLESFGCGQEQVASPTSISPEGEALQQAMQESLANMLSPDPIDAIFVHAPGTNLGDKAELHALQRTFGDDLPLILSNKWQIGHLLGASGALSIEHALALFEGCKFQDFPYLATVQNRNKQIRKIMINSAGFGGNASSVIIAHPDIHKQA